MSFSEKTLKILEFDKIRQMLSSCAPTQGSKEIALSLMPSDDVVTVKKRLQKTTDALMLFDRKGLPPFGTIIDLSDSCERATKGAMLSPKELLDVASLFRSARQVADYVKENKPFSTTLDELFDRLLPNRYLEDLISKSIFSVDMIADEASKELADIRRKIRETNTRIKDVLQKYISGSYSSILQDNIVTMRDGRYVVPVKTECKNEMKGLIHDTSASGSTVFIEPMAVVEANNDLRLLQIREEREIEKILFTLSSEVSSASETIRLNYYNLTQLAFYFACAELSTRMDAVNPIIDEERHIQLKRARHPLIDRTKVVPVNITLGGEYSALIITGPNTGGKTVTLKTLGLFSLMAQAGLHIPCDDGSSLCIFENILVDLGDEQSIEQSLSTFSSHMVNIVRITDEVTPKSLCLFDELGAGTDPAEGAALAIAIIETVHTVGALCAATTHYTELKTYALNTKGVQNASCEFDVSTLQPTYRLLIGTPGKSNAFAISEKLGLSNIIIQKAQSYLSTEHAQFEDVIEKLEAARLEADKQLEESRKLKAKYEKLLTDTQNEIRQKTARAENDAKIKLQKAEDLLETARASANFVYAQLEKAKKAEEAGNLSKELDNNRAAAKKMLQEANEAMHPENEHANEHYVLPRPLKKGDRLFIISIGTEGTLLELPDHSGNILVQAGIMKTKTNVKNVRLVEEETKIISNGKSIKASSFHPSVSQSFSPELDIRGMLGEEGWQRVDKYLDDAMMSGVNIVRIIHGKGTGALKKHLWTNFRTDKRIKSFRIGQFGEGDGGVTVIELK